MLRPGGHYDIIDVLGQKGADLKKKNDEGLTCYYAALDCAYSKQTLSALQAHGVRRPGFFAGMFDALCAGPAVAHQARDGRSRSSGAEETSAP